MLEEADEVNLFALSALAFVKKQKQKEKAPILGHIIDCKILPAQLHKLFDHVDVYLVHHQQDDRKNQPPLKDLGKSFSGNPMTSHFYNFLSL